MKQVYFLKKRIRATNRELWWFRRCLSVQLENIILKSPKLTLASFFLCMILMHGDTNNRARSSSRRQKNRGKLYKMGSLP